MKSRLFFLKTTLILQIYFAESYKNDQQEATQSAYFGNRCFSIFTACCYTKSPSNNDVRNDNIITVAETSDHDKITSMNRQQKFIHKIEYMHEKSYENVFVWSDEMGSQFRSCYVFKLLASTVLPGKILSWNHNEVQHGKGPIDGIAGTLKNVIFRKVKSGQSVV